MLKTMKVKKGTMRRATVEGFLTATDAADYLVKKALPFRKAHEVVGKIVANCVTKGKTLEDLTLKDWKGFSGLFSRRDILRAVRVESSVTSRKIYGGTAKTIVTKQLKKWKMNSKRVNMINGVFEIRCSGIFSLCFGNYCNDIRRHRMRQENHAQNLRQRFLFQVNTSCIAEGSVIHALFSSIKAKSSSRKA